MLRTVNIPQGITSIDGVFSGCSRLTSVNIPSSVTSINSAFSDCSSLTSVNIPDGVTSIGESTFYYCSSLTSILIPDSVTSIGNRAFYYCSSLTSVTIPQSVTNIRGAAFSGCSSLTSVNIPDSVTSIEYGAFSGCNNLKKITLPNIQYIDQNAFNNCYILEKVTIPKTVTSIWGNAFYGCYSLSEVCYEGTKEEWQQISIASGNDCLSNATIVYNYIESKCSIYYDTNGSNDVIDTVEATIGDTIKVSGIVPQKEHYKFIGWATDNLSQVPKYLPNDEFKAEKSITLYAIWEPVPFITATYNNYGNYKLFFASFNNMPENSVIYFAEYSDGTLLSTEKRNYTSNSEVFASFEKANKYKIFVWNDDMMPLCEAYETE